MQTQKKMLPQYDKRRGKISEATKNIMNAIGCDRFSNPEYLKDFGGPRSGASYGYISHQQYADTVSALNACLANDAATFAAYMTKTGFNKDSKIACSIEGEPQNPFSQVQTGKSALYKSILEFAHHHKRDLIVDILNEKFSPPPSNDAPAPHKPPSHRG